MVAFVYVFADRVPVELGSAGSLWNDICSCLVAWVLTC